MNIADMKKWEQMIPLLVDMEIHHDEVAQSTQQHKDMEDFMLSPVSGKRDLKGIEYPANGIEYATGDQPDESADT